MPNISSDVFHSAPTRDALRIMKEPDVLRTGDAPTPFTSEEIRAGCPDGRTVASVTTIDGVETASITRFSQCDDEGAEVTVDGEGHRVRWHDLQAHASFPAKSTTIVEDTIDTPLGTMQCLRYTVARGDESHIFWFARSRPGMPVTHVVERGGRTLSETVVVSDEIVAD